MSAEDYDDTDMTPEEFEVAMARAHGAWHTRDGVNWYYDGRFYNTGNSNMRTFVGVASFDPNREQLEQWFEEGEPVRLVRNCWLIRLLRMRSAVRRLWCEPRKVT